MRRNASFKASNYRENCMCLTQVIHSLRSLEGVTGKEWTVSHLKALAGFYPRRSKAENSTFRCTALSSFPQPQHEAQMLDRPLGFASHGA